MKTLKHMILGIIGAFLVLVGIPTLFWLLTCFIFGAPLTFDPIDGTIRALLVSISLSIMVGIILGLARGNNE